MRQSTVIFGTLLAAFVIYITLRGQLPSYFSLFTGATVAPPNSGTQVLTPHSTGKNAEGVETWEYKPISSLNNLLSNLNKGFA